MEPLKLIAGCLILYKKVLLNINIDSGKYHTAFNAILE
jgi:hypothetical protein